MEAGGLWGLDRPFGTASAARGRELQDRCGGARALRRHKHARRAGPRPRLSLVPGRLAVTCCASWSDPSVPTAPRRRTGTTPNLRTTKPKEHLTRCSRHGPSTRRPWTTFFIFLRRRYGWPRSRQSSSFGERVPTNVSGASSSFGCRVWSSFRAFGEGAGPLLRVWVHF